MRSAKQVPGKAASRKGARARVFSTSEARANFAAALETAQVEKAVVGFERYGRTIAVLAPIEAVYMLAGRPDMLPASVRRRLQNDALQLVRKASISGPNNAPGPPKKAPSKKKRRKSRA